MAGARSHRLARGALVLFASPLALLIAVACSSSSDDSQGTQPELPMRPETGTTTSPEAASCSTNLDVDPKNCGRCGHDCRGGACLGSLCQPVVIAAGQSEPNLIGSDSTTLIFSTSDTPLVSVLKDGSGQPAPIVHTLPTAQQRRGAWVFDGTSFFASEVDQDPMTTTNRIVRLSRTGGTPTTLTTYTDPFGDIGGGGGGLVAVSAGYVFFATTFGQLASAVSKTGGGNLPIANDFRLPAATANDVLYFSSGNTVHRASIATDGGMSEVIATGTSVTKLQVLGTDVFYTSDSTGSVRRVRIGDLDAGAGTLLAFGQDGPQAFAIDATTIYFSASGENTILACPLAGCGAEPRVLAKRQFGVSQIIVDDQGVYWSATTGGTIVRVAK